MLTSILLGLHVLIATGLIGLILVQHGKGADMGAAFGAGASGTVFGAKGSANFLTRTTAVLAAAFFVNSIVLAYMASQRVQRTSVLEQVEAVQEVEAPAEVPQGLQQADMPTAPGDVPAVPQDAAPE